MAKKPRAGAIDTSTGRHRRDKGPLRERRVLAPQRSNGRIVRGGRLAFMRARATRSSSDDIRTLW